MSRQIMKRLLFAIGLFIIAASVIILFILPFDILVYYILHFFIIIGLTCVSIAMIMHVRDNKEKEELRFRVLKMVSYSLFFITAAFFGIVLFTLVLVFFVWKLF